MISSLDDTKNRLAYTENEFEQLKHDYYNSNLKQKELLNTCASLENQNRNLLHSIEQIEQEKLQLKQTFRNEEEKLLKEIKQINELHAHQKQELLSMNEHQKQELLSIHKQVDHNGRNFKQDIESLQLRINSYETDITHCEEYRVKLENNLQKITQQRDTNKVDLRLTQEMLSNKEDEYNQLKLRFDEYEKHLQTNKERFTQYETTINDLQRHIKQYEFQSQEFNQTRLTISQVDLNFMI